MKLPKEFQLMGRTFQIVWDKNLVTKTDVVGQASYRELKVFLQPDCPGARRPRDSVEQAFYHELVHHILDIMEENELSKNEKFVEIFSGLLHQFEKTAKY